MIIIFSVLCFWLQYEVVATWLFHGSFRPLDKKKKFCLKNSATIAMAIGPNGNHPAVCGKGDGYPWCAGVRLPNNAHTGPRPFLIHLMGDVGSMLVVFARNHDTTTVQLAWFVVYWSRFLVFTNPNLLSTIRPITRSHLAIRPTIQYKSREYDQTQEQHFHQQQHKQY